MINVKIYGNRGAEMGTRTIFTALMEKVEDMMARDRDGRRDPADVGNVRTQMEMHTTQAIQASRWSNWNR